MQTMSRTDLSFLKDRQSVYYTGLDDKVFPVQDRRSKQFRLSLEQHLRYLKVLCLLTDHIAIPPTFLAFAMSRASSSDLMKRYLMDFFQAKLLLTSVYSTMSNPKDFIELKIAEGTQQEKHVFSLRQTQISDFFSHIPLLQRNVVKMSTHFRSRLINNLRIIPPFQLPDGLKEDILSQIYVTEVIGEVSLSRETFLQILNNLRMPNRAYLACYYAMNSAYYAQGAETYSSNISCLNAEEFSILGRHMFFSKPYRVVPAYDPSLFLHVLLCHGITLNEIDTLDLDNLLSLRRTQEFLTFKELYFQMCSLIQDAKLAIPRLSRKGILKFKQSLIESIEARCYSERKAFYKWQNAEDFVAAIILGGLAFALTVVPIGLVAAAIIGSSAGFIPPLLRTSGRSPAESIARKLLCTNCHFYLYLELLQEKISRLLKKEI